MANVIKYTGETIKASLGNLSDGHHLEFIHVKASSNDIVGLTTTEFKKFTGYATSSLSINTLSSASSNTVTITAYPQWNNSYSGASCTNTVEIRQATTFTKTKNTELWVGGTAEISYTLTYNPYDKGVGISVLEGAVSASSKPATAETHSLTVTAKKSGTSSVSFTPNTPKGEASKGSTTVTVRQPISAINVDKTSANVNSGGSVTIKIAVSATNANDSNATNNIYRSVVYHSFGGTATGSNSASAALTVAKSTTPTTALTLSNITKGGKITLAALAGTVNTDNAAVPTGVTVQKTINITLNNIAINLYSDSNCTITKTAEINAGDYFYVKITGGTGTNGTLSSTTSGIIIENTNQHTTISDNSGTSKVTVGSSLTGSFTLKFTPSNGSAVSKDITIKAPTLTLE